MMPWQFRQGPAEETPRASGAARVGAPCTSHQAAACALSHSDSLRVNIARLAHTQVGTATPGLYSMQAAPYQGEGIVANRLLLSHAAAHIPPPVPYADDRLPLAVHAAHQATQARSHANMSSMLAAALASHVQQHCPYSQRFDPVSDGPRFATHALSFPALDPEAPALPPYDDSVAPGIQYIEEEVVGPVPPAEAANEGHDLAPVKAEPCTSVHDFGTGDSQGCSHTVANMPTIPLSLNARDTAAVDSASASHSGCPARVGPPASTEGGVATRTRRARMHAAASASCTATSHDRIDALAILADVALAEATEVDELAAALEGPVARSAPPHAGRDTVNQVRKTRCMPLSALVAPVAPQREAARAGARSKKRKSSQPKATHRTAAHKATRAAQAAKTAQTSVGGPASEAAAKQPEAAEEAGVDASATGARATSTKPTPKTTQLAALNATARVVDPTIAGPEQGAALPPVAAGPSPQHGSGGEQPAQPTATQPQQMPLSRLRPLRERACRQRTAQRASTQAKRQPDAPVCASPRRGPSRRASAGQGGQASAGTEPDMPVRSMQRSAVDPVLPEVRRCASSAEPSQVQTASKPTQGARQMNAPAPAVQAAKAWIGVKVPALPARAVAQNLTARFVGASQQQKSVNTAVALADSRAAYTTSAAQPRATDQRPGASERPVPSVPVQSALAPGAVAGGPAQKRRRLASSAGSMRTDTVECGAARSASDDTAPEAEVPTNGSCPVAASAPGGNGKEQMLPTSATSADNHRVTRASALICGNTPASTCELMQSATPAQSNADPTSTVADTAAGCDASVPENAGPQTAIPLGGSPQPKRSDAINDFDTAKMAVKLQAQAEKQALRAAAAKAARVRPRRTPPSHTYPLLGGIPKRKGVYYRCDRSCGWFCLAM